MESRYQPSESGRANRLVLREQFNTFYDDASNIDRGDRRQNEVDAPFCVSDVLDSERDRCRTVRARDAMSPGRVPIEGLASRLRDRLEEGS